MLKIPYQDSSQVILGCVKLTIKAHSPFVYFVIYVWRHCVALLGLKLATVIGLKLAATLKVLPS